MRAPIFQLKGLDRYATFVFLISVFLNLTFLTHILLDISAWIGSRLTLSSNQVIQGQMAISGSGNKIIETALISIIPIIVSLLLILLVTPIISNSRILETINYSTSLFLIHILSILFYFLKSELNDPTITENANFKNFLIHYLNVPEVIPLISTFTLYLFSIILFFNTKLNFKLTLDLCIRLSFIPLLSAFSTSLILQIIRLLNLSPYLMQLTSGNARILAFFTIFISLVFLFSILIIMKSFSLESILRFNVVLILPLLSPFSLPAKYFFTLFFFTSVLFLYCSYIAIHHLRITNLFNSFYYSVLGIFLFLPDRPNSVDYDLYSSGEYLTPLQQFLSFGKLPYLDISPARGIFQNYLIPLISRLLFGNAPAYYFYGTLFFSLFFSIVFYIFLLPYTNSVLLKIITVFIWPQILTNFLYLNYALSLVVLIFCFLNKQLFVHLRSAPLIPIASILLILLMPFEGLVTAILIHILFLYFLQSGKHFSLRWILLYLSGYAVLFLSIVRNMLFGAIDYVYQQGSVNHLAHSISLKTSMDKSTYPEFLRSGLLLVITSIILIILAIHFYSVLNSKEIVVLVFLGLFLCLMIPRVYGRIDDGLSRHGGLSILALTLVLPISLYCFETILSVQLARVVLSSVLFCILLFLPKQPNFAFGDLSFTPYPSKQPSFSNSIWLDNTPSEDKYLSQINNRMRQLNSMIGRFGFNFKQDEFLDLTNNGADFYYLDLPSISPQISLYNLVSYQDQEKLVSKLKDANVLVLVDSETQIGDGGPLSLRNPILFQYLFLNYEFFICQQNENRSVWAVSSSRPIPRSCSYIDKKLTYLFEDIPSMWVNSLGNMPMFWGNGFLKRSTLEITENKFSLLKMNIECNANDSSRAVILIKWGNATSKIDFNVSISKLYTFPLYAYDPLNSLPHTSFRILLPQGCSLISSFIDTI